MCQIGSVDPSRLYLDYVSVIVLSLPLRMYICTIAFLQLYTIEAKKMSFGSIGMRFIVIVVIN